MEGTLVGVVETEAETQTETETGWGVVETAKRLMSAVTRVAMIAAKGAWRKGAAGGQP